METWLDKSTIYQGRIFSVERGTAALDDGTRVPREIVLHHGGVGVLPVLDDAVILVRQFRIATGKEILEIPAGKLEPGEDPAYRAQCELEEEAGYRAGRLEKIAACYCSPGFTNQRDHIYLGFDLEAVPRRLEFDERIELVHVPHAEIPSCLRNDIEDAKTILALQAFLLRGS